MGGESGYGPAGRGKFLRRKSLTSMYMQQQRMDYGLIADRDGVTVD